MYLQKSNQFKWENAAICINKNEMILSQPTLFICIAKNYLWPTSCFSLLITATGHIKLTDFGLSKIGLMSCKWHFIALLCMHEIADLYLLQMIF